MQQYFSILFLEENAKLDDVKNAYRKLVKKFHPDMNSGSDEYTSEFRQIQEAYDQLINFFNNSKKIPNNIDTSKTNNINEESNLDTANRDIVVSKIHNIDDSIEIGYFRYKINSFDYFKIIGKDFLTSEADGIYLIINLNITNRSSLMKKIHNYMFRLHNSNNEFFEFSSKGLSTLIMNQERMIDYFGKELNPRISIDIKLIYEVPSKDLYFLNLSGGEYNLDYDGICTSDEIEIVKIQ